MNAVEIEEAISLLADQSFDPSEFPYAFLEAFGNKATTIKQLRKGTSNKSDIEDGVLQRNNIHIAVCEEGMVADTLQKLKDSPTTSKSKAKFVLATDGKDFQAEDVNSGETVACDYPDFHNHFGFFLPLAGISTVKQIRENSFDIKATSRLNKLYIELLQHNPEWAKEERRHDMNHFLARLIFCFFAEDTDIFPDDNLFTTKVQEMSASDASNTHEVIGEIFRAMDTKLDERTDKKIKSWATGFPYVNGELFSGSTETPKFTKIARSYLLHVGNLDWQQINPDIFGSMIQAVADEDERGALGMHYTSVPNILKVLNPLFLDDLREQLEEAGDNARKLLNLRKRIARIRVFDPACGSGNFLVIAYKQMREIEHEINKRRGDTDQSSEIPLTNYRGIELRDFSAEVARLALIIAEYQCDVLYRGKQLALAEFLPLNAKNWITCGNALKIDWLSVCPPTGRNVKLQGDDLFSTPLEQSEIDFENEGGETYICGNPPFSGFNSQTPEQKIDLKNVLSFTKDHKYFDYVSGWFAKAAVCLDYYDSCALVSTNSIVQGVQVPILWRPLFATGVKIHFAHQSFIWENNAANNAGVACVIIGMTKKSKKKYLFHEGLRKEVLNINGYLTDASNTFVERTQNPISDIAPMATGNVAYEGGNLILSTEEKRHYLEKNTALSSAIRPLTGSKEFIRGEKRFCIWIPKQLVSRDKVHVVAMTGSYFRGDANPVLAPDDEAKFDTVTYTYYEQLNGYEYLKTLNIGYYFYSEAYADEILNVLDPNEKTIIHIPNVNSRESMGDKIKEVEHIIEELGDWQGIDPDTGFHLVKTSEGKIIKIADLVDDDKSKRDKVSASLKRPEAKKNRDHVDVIIALGMAKEGFDWIWCEHALTVGYRSSLTEIVQIIGRATRDAPKKTHARFTNLIAEPDAAEDAVRQITFVENNGGCITQKNMGDFMNQFDYCASPMVDESVFIAPPALFHQSHGHLKFNK